MSDLIRANTDWTVIRGDDWFEPLDDDIRWGDFNDERFRADVIVPIQLGQPPFDRPYSWAEGRIVDRGRYRTTAPVVVERCFLFDCGVDWDLLVWVETPATSVYGAHAYGISLRPTGWRRSGPSVGSQMKTATSNGFSRSRSPTSSSTARRRWLRNCIWQRDVRSGNACSGRRSVHPPRET